MKAALDTIDRKLLELLQRDGRMSQNELAKEVGLAVSSVNDRLRKLTERGVITGIHAHVSPAALGLDLMSLVFVGWADDGVEDAFLAHIQALPNVLACHHITGSWNYVMRVHSTNTNGLEVFLSNLKKAVKGIQRTETMIVLSSAKLKCSYGTHEAEDHRL